MRLVVNPHRGAGPLAPEAPYPSTAADRVAALLARCPAAAETPLVDATRLAPLAALWVKDERARMGLGAFKALGAAYVIAAEAAARAAEPGADTLKGQCYVTASAGNHGMSVAAGARVFGARAVVVIARSVPQVFADRLRAKGAEVLRAGDDYAGSMEAAAALAAANGWTLLSDSSWPGYSEAPLGVMEGYLQLAAEAARQCPEPPSHIFLQAGVGGLAAAVAAHARQVWGAAPRIVVVEPAAAPALQASIAAGRAVFAPGPESSMGRLDCKEPSLIALNGLARDADAFLTLTDAAVEACLPALAAAGLANTPSGAAGLAAVLLPEARAALDLGPEARALCILSEGPE